MIKKYKKLREKRKEKIRHLIKGTKERPRLSVFRSNKFLYGQLIDDQKGKTLISFNSQLLKKDKEKKMGKIEIGKEVGKALGKMIKEKKIKKIVFDRSGYKYHGRVKALAQGLREEGLEF